MVLKRAASMLSESQPHEIVFDGDRNAIEPRELAARTAHHSLSQRQERRSDQERRSIQTGIKCIVR
jgi:hypothetical protein